MAFLLPRNIPSRNDISGRLNLLGGSLRDALDDADEVTIWLEQDGEEAHLLLLDPTCGILLLEAPPLRAAPRIGGRRRRRRQAAEIRETVRRRLSELRDHSQQQLDSLPVGHTVAFPDLERRAVARRGWTADGRGLLSQEDFHPGRLRGAFRRALGEPARALEPEDVQRARAVVNPRIVINRPGVQGQLAFRPSELSSEEVLRVLDREQERVAEHLGWGYQVLRGVAGSGKTLVLLHRARHLAGLFGWRILILCYNKALSLELAHRLDEIDRVEVRTVDSLAFEYAPLRGGDDIYELRRKTALERVRTLGGGKRFDTVMVDEAQDIGNTGMDLAWEMLKPRRRDSRNSGNFIMAQDPDQDIYLHRRREMDWNPPGLTARGRTTIFRRNYRNTRQILELAWWLLSELSNRRDERDVVEPEVVREGPPPSVIECGDLPGEARYIADRVKELLNNGVEPDSILVMFGPAKTRIEQLCRPFERLDIPCHFITPRKTEELISLRGKVWISTLRIPKGLEFPRVFIGGANHVSMPVDQDNPESKGHLLYVAMTRAMDELTVTYSGEGPVGEALRRCFEDIMGEGPLG